MAKLNDLAVGQRWAYRASDYRQPLEVEILEVGAVSPWHVEVQFVSAAERPDKWVSPARLAVLWSEREAFFELESAWRALSTQPDAVEAEAVDLVFDLLLLGAATIDWSKIKFGTVTVLNETRAEEVLRGGLRGVIEDAPHISDADGTHYGWGVAVGLAHVAAAQNAQRVMTYVHAEEADGARFATAYYAEYTRPVLELLRSWCGAGAVSEQDELLRMRKQISHAADVMSMALALLSKAGQPEASWRLYNLYSPGESKRDWRVVMALALGRARSVLLK